MSIFKAILLLIPFFLIAKAYSKAMQNHSVESTLRIYSDATPGNVNFLILKAAKLADRVFKELRLLGFFSYVIVLLNAQFDKVPAWVILIFVGVVSSYAIYRHEEVVTAKFAYSSRGSESRSAELLQEARKLSIIVLAVSIAIAGNWGYRNYKDLSQVKADATYYALNVAENGWCANFADIDVYDSGETVVKKGGWPCIYVGSIKNIDFFKKNKELGMCFDATLNREQGLPGYESFQLGYRTVNICAVDNWETGLNEDTFNDKLFDAINPELESLKRDLCIAYAGRMSYLDQGTYC